MASNIDATVPADGTHPTKKSFRDNFSAAKAEIEALQASTPSTTDDLTEGATNLYYTDARVRAAVSASGDLSYNSSTGQFSVTVPVDSVAGKTGAVTLDTDDVSEATNLYYTNVRARASISVSGSLLGYDSGTGVISLSGVAELAAANTFTANQTIESTNAGAGEGPVLYLHRNSASPAASDVLGIVRFRGEDSGSNVTEYATIYAAIADPTDTSEDGTLNFQTVVAGTTGNRLKIGNGIYTAGATGGDQGADTINASGFYKNGVELSGTVLQIVKTQTGAVSTGTTTIPLDDTIPQNTEGDEYMTLAITPQSASSRLRIDVVAVLAHSATSTMQMALFRDSGASAIASAAEVLGAGTVLTMSFSHDMASPGTSATTFKIRAGSQSGGTTTFNGLAGSRLHGGVLASSIIITEYTT